MMVLFKLLQHNITVELQDDLNVKAIFFAIG